jgi:DNA-binding YbaB/EbfC family protein
VTIEGPDAGSDPDIGGLVEQLGHMQQSLQAAQDAVMSTAIEGTAGGGAVTITGTGGLTISAVTIDPKIVDPTDVDMLQDLVLAAIRDIVEQAQALQARAVGGLGLEGLLGG